MLLEDGHELCEERAMLVGLVPPFLKLPVVILEIVHLKDPNVRAIQDLAPFVFKSSPCLDRGNAAADADESALGRRIATSPAIERNHPHAPTDAQPCQ